MMETTITLESRHIVAAAIAAVGLLLLLWYWYSNKKEKEFYKKYGNYIRIEAYRLQQAGVPKKEIRRRIRKDIANGMADLHIEFSDMLGRDII